ncbi:MAG: T9SS type A sorting domain-containing protein [Flavobacteriales bacterium]|nr:T9SS type A sorting domain-containing protein [Flavobacteriales bacterium]
MKKIAILLLLIATISADQLKVPSAYSTIQAGLNAASSGDTVLVAAGTYKENLIIDNSNRATIFIIGNDKSNTIIDGSNIRTVVIIKGGSATIKNFTIQNGYQEGNFFIEQLGLNTSAGGIYGNNSNLNLDNLIIKNNYGEDGGGILIDYSEKNVLSNLDIRNNTTRIAGGGIKMRYSGVKMKNVLVAENRATSTDRAGIALTNCNNGIEYHEVELINLTVVNNIMDLDDGYNGKSWANGIYTNECRYSLKNSIIWGNDDLQIINKGNGIQGKPISSTITYSNIEGAYTGTGNIDSNPKFMKVITTGDEESDYHLKDSSPAIGAGTATGAPTTDIEGNPRPNPAGSNPDMGAFENKWGTPQNATPVITAVSDVTINEDESYSDTLRATDEEGDAITYSASSDTSAVTASITDSILTLMPNANWNGVANIKAYASDGSSKDSTSFKITVTALNDPPTAFEYITSARDTAIISSNLEKTYDLEWTPSYDVEGETITYKVYISLGEYDQSQLFYDDTTVTKIQIPYSELNNRIFEGGMLGTFWNDVVRGRTALTVKFKVIAFDDSYQQYAGANQNADDRELYINRYDYLSVEGVGIPTEFALHENYPNPFNPTTTLRFDLPEVSNITLTIFNMLGQKIRTYDMQSAAAGYHTLKWNATNDYGDPVGAGVYLYQLQTKDFVKTRKMVLLK